MGLSFYTKATALANLEHSLEGLLEDISAALREVQALEPDDARADDLWDIARNLPNGLDVKDEVESTAQEWTEDEEADEEDEWEEDYDDYDDFDMALEYDDEDDVPSAEETR
jgi:hypothetical protein